MNLSARQQASASLDAVGILRALNRGDGAMIAVLLDECSRDDERVLLAALCVVSVEIVRRYATLSGESADDFLEALAASLR